MTHAATSIDALFQTARLGPTTLPNRVAVAPMTRVSGDPDGSANDRNAAYYEVFAHGGFGLVITEGLYPDTAHSQGYLNQPGLATETHARSWTPVVDRVHKAGAKMFAQLMHAGAQSQGNRYTDTSVAPSTVPPRGEQLGFYGGTGSYPTPRALTASDIADVRSGFTRAARNAVRAGFDGVEIHGANGYLLDQFLTDYMNQRDDVYGGSVENRVRIFREVIAETREEVGSEITIGVRISQSKVSDYLHRWSGGESDAAVIFTALAEAGVDYIHTTEFDATAAAFPDSDRTLASLAVEHSKLPVIANGQLGDPATAASMVERGTADVVALGKPALANRDWVRRAQQAQTIETEVDDSVFNPMATVKDWEVSR
ncbi:NADH:flavin oxidoreductase [Rhodococcus sp. Leaf7]|uniref:oxidoreductase n=1 Tax=unclassified Rhodococcus (in: high G+C Gram-positive bacteria) TaxID=192944 RepID=UPI0006FD651B|nr:MULTISPECIES: NADH:flavin oxidoreductase [unclassified Rhodococcus (in: high G+C Gram-positive bacteria)]KQU01924.1 NADH:flavin oxidoreductase [Rhodococcus sp. Leaf7]KQU38217.1 NADH:flavin oxidoreductase [Rhodococcus sp. Leaf247]